MGTNPDDAVRRLRQLKRLAKSNAHAYAQQFDLCLELGCRTLDIANATGLTAQAVSMRRRKWRERRLMAETVE